MKKTIEAKGTEIAIISRNNGDDYISLTDIEVPIESRLA